MENKIDYYEHFLNIADRRISQMKECKKDLKDFFAQDPYSVHFEDVELWGTGREQCRKEKGFLELLKPSYTLHYIISGKGELYLGDDVVHIGEGDMLFSFPYELLCTRQDEEDPYDWVFISFDGKLCASLMAQVGADHSTPLIRFGKNPTILEDVLSYHDNCLKNGPFSFQTASCILKLFYDMVEFSKGKYVAQNKKEQNVFDAIRFVNESLPQKTSSTTVAEQLGVTSDYLGRIFKESVGVTLTEYITKKRMEYARAFVLHSDLAGSEIARMMGYGDVHNFYRDYKNYFGAGPGDMRKDVEQKQNAIIEKSEKEFKTMRNVVER